MKLYDDSERALTIISWGFVVFTVCYITLHAIAMVLW